MFPHPLLQSADDPFVHALLIDCRSLDAEARMTDLVRCSIRSEGRRCALLIEPFHADGIKGALESQRQE